MWEENPKEGKPMQSGREGLKTQSTSNAPGSEVAFEPVGSTEVDWANLILMTS